MVPSWTETLIWAGVNVVGRTRFCLHPEDRVSEIPIVGGTKNWNLDKVRGCQPDLLVLDKEENPREMAEEESLPFWASHVRGVDCLPNELESLSASLGNDRLGELAVRWRAVTELEPRPIDPGDLPGVVEWGRKPTRPISSVVYVIWRDPWMAVGPKTFIGSMLARLGLSVHPFDSAYPEFSPSELAPDSLLLFSSEPYPFLRKREGLEEMGQPYAFVDGEKFSWFGIRSLQFLEAQL